MATQQRLSIPATEQLAAIGVLFFGALGILAASSFAGPLAAKAFRLGQRAVSDRQDSGTP